nr:hypothetical protein [Salmonella enterica]
MLKRAAGDEKTLSGSFFVPICTRLTAQIVKVAVNQPVAIRSSMWAKNNQNIHFMNLHVKKLEKLLLF